MNIPRHMVVRALVPVLTLFTLIMTIWTKAYSFHFDEPQGELDNGFVYPLSMRQERTQVEKREDLIVKVRDAQIITYNNTALALPLYLTLTEDYNLTGSVLELFKESIDINGESAETMKAYDRYLSDRPLDCRHQGRYGHVRDGGYDVCLAGAYRPLPGCLVYSFGIRDDFSFDDAMADDFQCNVQCFDPRQPNYTHRRSERIMFYNIAIGSSNQREYQLYPCLPMSHSQYRTLGTIIQASGHADRIIDLLKIDIEGCEWNIFPTIITENVLPRVKQLLLEVHAASEPSVTNYKMAYAMFQQLDDLGFKKFHTSWTTYGGLHRSVITHNIRAKAHDLGYLNTNFLDPDYRSNGLPGLNLSESVIGRYAEDFKQHPT